MSTKRQDIVDAATRLFARDGYHAVGIDRIISESGVAKMTMYRHFATKDELVAHVLTQRAQQSLTLMAEAVARKTSPIERLHEVFVWHERWLMARDFTEGMFAGALHEFHSHSVEIMRVAAAQKEHLQNFLQDIVTEIVPVRPADRVLARQLVMILDGAIQSAMAGDERHAAAQAWDIALKLVSAEIRAGTVKYEVGGGLIFHIHTSSLIIKTICIPEYVNHGCHDSPYPIGTRTYGTLT
ncbi:hypothetical protein R75461_08109 [Paraburkholderia nemoris]|uniref:TetR/AcrR family transcriptional regulator n=1 Tax=Paraburkholderia nemoris TaxID=2793076 RepID=UPI00190C5E95|nr:MULTISPECIES: TetR/AcrR family transcriptional regulator [Paraburkholderia]MBK3786744.1 TetR/AcrR family transcriptional regulator [Paraburkholderia aspalathi]CAE6863402.1 hypothetical protein R75461_08109 [Paraburkholderia nemoris]